MLHPSQFFVLDCTRLVPLSPPQSPLAHPVMWCPNFAPAISNVFYPGGTFPLLGTCCLVATRPVSNLAPISTRRRIPVGGALPFCKPVFFTRFPPLTVSPFGRGQCPPSLFRAPPLPPHLPTPPFLFVRRKLRFFPGHEFYSCRSIFPLRLHPLARPSLQPPSRTILTASAGVDAGGVSVAPGLCQRRRWARLPLGYDPQTSSYPPKPLATPLQVRAAPSKPTWSNLI